VIFNKALPDFPSPILKKAGFSCTADGYWILRFIHPFATAEHQVLQSTWS